MLLGKVTYYYIGEKVTEEDDEVKKEGDEVKKEGDEVKVGGGLEKESVDGVTGMMSRKLVTSDWWDLV